jgi:hypothetical protein
MNDPKSPQLLPSPNKPNPKALGALLEYTMELYILRGNLLGQSQSRPTS